jgi:ribosomal protein L7Ae-like RNA K-turn-binding protein
MSASDRTLGLLGLAFRAGVVVSGVEQVREGARSGRLLCVIVARDASVNSRGKLIPLLQAQRIPVVERFDRATLGDALGRSNLSAVGVTDASFAARIRALLEADANVDGRTKG